MTSLIKLHFNDRCLVFSQALVDCHPLTSFEKPSILELLESELFRPDAHQGDPAGSQVRLEFADFCSYPPADLTAKPTQEEENHGLVLPQRLELHGLEHRKGCYQQKLQMNSLQIFITPPWRRHIKATASLKVMVLRNDRFNTNPSGEKMHPNTVSQYYVFKYKGHTFKFYSVEQTQNLWAQQSHSSSHLSSFTL